MVERSLDPGKNTGRLCRLIRTTRVIRVFSVICASRVIHVSRMICASRVIHVSRMICAFWVICALSFLMIVHEAPGAPEDEPLIELSDLVPPESPPLYHQPISKPSSILQGNKGWFSHDEPISRYAWDYSMHVGSPVAAARAGVVTLIRMESNIGGADFEHFQNEANSIIIDHLDGTCAQYYHLSKDGCRVRLGEYVLQGEPIACSGDTGYTLGPHLHFAVLDQEARESLPVRFSDFKDHDGIPAVGDLVPAAAPPNVPPERITRYKHAWRACQAALNDGHLGLALRFTQKVPESMRHPYYFYDQALVSIKEALRTWLNKRMKYLAALEKPTASERFESLRLLTTLEEIPDWTLLQAREDLKEAMRNRPDDILARWEAERAAIDDWIEGLILEYTGEPREAAGCYVSAMQRSRGLVHPEARSRLAKVISDAHTRLHSVFSRLEYECLLALNQHKPRIAGNARKVWLREKPFLQMWIIHFPDERKEAIEALTQAKERYLSLTGI